LRLPCFTTTKMALLIRQVTCLGPVGVIALGIVGGAIMLNKRKDVAYYLIALIVVSLLISTLA
jgi:hypothetical protein